MARQARRRPRRPAEGRNPGRPSSAGELTAGGSASGEVTSPAPARTTRVAPEPVRRRRLIGLRRLTPRGVKDIVSELRKVTWPSLEDTRYLTIVVSIVAIVVGIFLGGVDLFFGWMIERIFFS